MEITFNNKIMLTGRIGVNKELVTKELPLLNIHVDKIADYKAILEEGQFMDKKYEGVNNADLEDIDTLPDQEVFYYCKQPKVAISMQHNQRMGIYECKRHDPGHRFFC